MVQVHLGPPRTNNGDLAQLVEHRLCKAGVRGSIPLVSTRENPSHVAGFFVLHQKISALFGINWRKVLDRKGAEVRDQNIFENATIIVSYPNPRTTPTVIASYLRAVERFRNAYESSISIDELQVHYREIGYSALLEAVTWARAFIENCELSKEKFPDQEFAFALTFARNQLLHSWHELIDISMSKKSDAKWLWSAKKGEDFASKSNYIQYCNRLKGKEIISTLEEFSKIIWPMRGWKLYRHNIEQPGIDVKTNLEFDLG